MSSISNRNGILHISYYRGGNHHRYSLRLKANQSGYKKALQIKQQLDADIAKDRLKLILFNIPERQTSLKLSEALLEYYKIKDIPENDKGVYYSAFKLLIEHTGDIYINDLTAQHFNKLKSTNKSEHTIHSYFNHIRIILKHFNINNIVPHTKVIDKEPTIIPDTHFNLICGQLKENNIHYLIKFLYHTGCRISEALVVTKKDIDFENNVLIIHNQKAHRKDIFPLYPELTSLLKAYISTHGDDLLFNYNRRYVLDTFRKASDKLSLPKYTLHDIRRTFITKYSKILSPLELLKVSRHTDISTTLKHYINQDIQSIGNKM